VVGRHQDEPVITIFEEVVGRPLLTALRNQPHCLRRTVLSRRVDRRDWNLFALAPAKRVLWGLLVC
jgi:hypothetical protein